MSVTILTIDDSRTMRDMLKITLEEGGYRVVQAVDGIHGLEVLQNETPRLIITDINMPRLDGFGLIKSVREDRRFPRRADLGPDDGKHRREKGHGAAGRRDRVDHQALRPRKIDRRRPTVRSLNVFVKGLPWIR